MTAEMRTKKVTIQRDLGSDLELFAEVEPDPDSAEANNFGYQQIQIWLRLRVSEVQF
jgi:hypothetical protein